MSERVTASRIAALEVLRRIRAGDLADRALGAALERLEGRDRGWTQELVYGTLRLRGRLDHALGGLVRGGIDALHPDVLDTLRLGGYQLLEMRSVPSYAAISQSQELVRWAGSARAAGLVAGVLHALQRRREEITYPDPGSDPVGNLSSWGSHPRWLVERWVGRWGASEAAALVGAINERPELFLRPLGITPQAAVERLAAAGIAAEVVTGAGRSVRIVAPAGAADALAAVPAVVQDPAASLVVDYAAVPQGARVVDLCAAPGGKALGLAERASRVVAVDVSVRRLARLEENVARLGWQQRVGVVAADGRVPPLRRASADVVLLDAPCTGTGTFRRHPDGKWRVRPDHLPELVALQRSLLAAAAELVRPGGWLVYSTCSLEAEENELQVEAFLRSTPGWEPDPPAEAPPGLPVDDAGRLVVLPHRHGFDGAFAARLRRAA